VQQINCLIAGYFRFTTPIVDICLATSVATAILAGIAWGVDKWFAPWDVAFGLFCVSGLYFVFGIAALVHSASRRPSDESLRNIENETWKENLGPVGPRFLFSARTVRYLTGRRRRNWLEHRRRIASGDNTSEGVTPHS
jgi:hypothetical protein